MMKRMKERWVPIMLLSRASVAHLVSVGAGAAALLARTTHRSSSSILRLTFPFLCSSCHGSPFICSCSLDDITKGALHIESDKNARARTARFIAMAGQYAALCIASGVRSQELWAGFLQTMELDQNAMVTDAQATLTGQTSMHGMDAIAATPISLPVPTSVLTASVASSRGPVLSSGAGASPSKPAAAAYEPAPAAASGGAMFSGSSETVTETAEAAPAPEASAFAASAEL